MEQLILTPGDFMKNAGIVGFLRLMELHYRKNGKLFTVTDTFNVEELRSIDLTQAYIDTFIEYYGKETKTAKAFERLENLIRLLEENHDNIERKKLQDDLAYISDRFSAARLKSGYEGIRDEVEYGDLYEDFLIHKIKAPKPKEELADFIPDILRRLKSLNKFLSQPIVKQTFIFKMVTYNVINNFWNKVSILNSQKKTVKAHYLLKTYFIDPFTNYISKTEYKEKSYCISCGMPMFKDEEKTSIAFMVDIADDLARKTSVFWNHKPDAFLCPICAFFYSLVPLGFCPVDNGGYTFINVNDSIETLWCNNQPQMDEEGKALPYHARIDQAILQLIERKEKTLNNIQVVTRKKISKSSNEDVYQYLFNVIDRELIQLTQNKPVKSALKQLAKRPSFKMSNDSFLNVYRLCIENLLNYQNQFNLLYLLVTESLKETKDVKGNKKRNTQVDVFLRPVLAIQCAQLSQKQENNSMDLSKIQHHAAKAGDELRPRLIADKVGQENIKTITDEKKEDIIRGVVYQLTNALKVQNVEQFTDLIIRLYSSCKQPIPTVFTQALRSGDQFAVIGYAFILGLKGAFYKKENNEGVN